MTRNCRKFSYGVVVVEEPPIYLFVVVVQLMVYKEHSFLVDAFDDLALELELNWKVWVLLMLKKQGLMILEMILEISIHYKMVGSLKGFF